MAVRFIDTNVILQALTATNPDQAAAARALLFRVEAGSERVTTSPLVLFEVIFTLHSPRSYNHPKERVIELVSPSYRAAWYPAAKQTTLAGRIRSLARSFY